MLGQQGDDLDGAPARDDLLQALAEAGVVGLPRSYAFVKTIPRHITGKANYPKAREIMLASLGQSGV